MDAKTTPLGLSLHDILTTWKLRITFKQKPLRLGHIIHEKCTSCVKHKAELGDLLRIGCSTYQTISWTGGQQRPTVQL